MRFQQLLLRITLPLLIAGLAGCASQPATMTDPERDPWEAYNRNIHSFNMGVDKAIFRPVAKGYDAIMPDAPQRGVRNFFRNLNYPVTFINLILQGKFEESLTATGRFLMNSTVGLAGFFDIATRVEIPEYSEDFGQTLAVWGVPPGPHQVLPFWGSSNIRDGVGLVPGFAYNNAVSFEDSHTNDTLFVTGIVDTRSQFLGLEDVLELQPDKYLFLREGYRQRRAAQIANGTVEESEDSDDALLDELLEDD